MLWTRQPRMIDNSHDRRLGNVEQALLGPICAIEHFFRRISVQVVVALITVASSSVGETPLQRHTKTVQNGRQRSLSQSHTLLPPCRPPPQTQEPRERRTLFTLR